MTITDEYDKVAQDHYLHVSFHDDKILAEFECLNHDMCEAAQHVEDSQADDYLYSIILEWFTEDTPVVLRSDYVVLEPTQENDFAQWRYLHNEPVYMLDNYLSMLKSAPKAAHAYVGYVQRRKGPIFQSYCLETHKRTSQSCLGEWLNEEDHPIQNFTGAENSLFRSDYITLELVTTIYNESQPNWKYSSEKTTLPYA